MSNDAAELLKGKSLFIATPCYGGVCSEQYARSLLMLTSAMTKISIPFNVTTIVNESLITRARNKLVSAFLSTTSTHLFFIDADIEFNYNDVLRMMAVDEDIVTGAYPLKSVRLDRIPGRNFDNIDDVNSAVSEYVINLMPSTDGRYQAIKGLIEVYDAGTGFMMIKREVIEKMIESYPETLYYNEGDPEPMYALFDTIIDDDKRYLSEDYTFCRRWQKIGGRVFLDPEIVLNHVGSYVFRGKKMFTYEEENV